MSSILDFAQENVRFYFGWGLLTIILGISLLVFAALGNLSLAISVFFIGLGISLLLLSMSKPALPLINLLGFALTLLGFLIYGIFVALLNPVSIIGIVVIAIGGGIIILASKKGVEK